MTRYRIDRARSQVTVVTRPRLGDGPGARVTAVDGEVETDGQADGQADGIDTEVVVRGVLTVSLDTDPAGCAAIDLTGGRVERGPDGTALVTGRADRPAGAFGLAGSPLVNPTVQLRWRLVLVPGAPSAAD